MCYSWWVLASLKIINRIHWIDKAKLRTFILACQDEETGGFADRPGDMVSSRTPHDSNLCAAVGRRRLLDLLLLTVTSSVAICSHLPAPWLLFHLPGPLCFSSAVHTDPIFCVSASYTKDNFYLTVDTLGAASVLECLKLCR